MIYNSYYEGGNFNENNYNDDWNDNDLEVVIDNSNQIMNLWRADNYDGRSSGNPYDDGYGSDDEHFFYHNAHKKNTNKM